MTISASLLIIALFISNICNVVSICFLILRVRRLEKLAGLTMEES